MLTYDKHAFGRTAASCATICLSVSVRVCVLSQAENVSQRWARRDNDYDVEFMHAVTMRVLDAKKRQNVCALRKQAVKYDHRKE